MKEHTKQLVIEILRDFRTFPNTSKTVKKNYGIQSYHVMKT